MKAKGYSLIEVLVVMTIIGVLFGVGYASYRDFSRRQTLIGVKKQIEGDLRKAQQNALSGIKPDDSKCNSSNSLVGHEFFLVDNTKYQIRANCTGGTVIEDEKTLTGITISLSAGTPNPIIFKVLGEGTNLSNTATITLTQTATGNSITISLRKGGPAQ